MSAFKQIHSDFPTSRPYSRSVMVMLLAFTCRAEHRTLLIKQVYLAYSKGHVQRARVWSAWPVGGALCDAGPPKLGLGLPPARRWVYEGQPPHPQAERCGDRSPELNHSAKGQLSYSLPNMASPRNPTEPGELAPATLKMAVHKCPRRLRLPSLVNIPFPTWPPRVLCRLKLWSR